jgi:hypothetical protein
MMDKIILPDKGVELETRFAAPSVLTGRFVCAVVDSDADEVREAFTDHGPILVQNTDGLYEDKLYTDFGGIHDLREEQGQITVVLNGRDDG